MATIVKDLGAATAYGYAVEKGYTGTEEEFAELMASYASVAESAADSADAAAQSATNASNSAAAAATSASSASASATTASTKAGEAETSAAAADGSASAAAQSATSASGSATSASESASAAAQSATSASGSATSASGSATAAANSATAAAASEAAAKAVEESIPADYTDLSEDISELKSKIEDILVEQSSGQQPETVTLTTILDADNFGVTSVTMFRSSVVDNSVTFGLDANNTAKTISCSKQLNAGNGKYIVAFKYRIRKVESTLSGPQNVGVILGESTKYDNAEYVYDEWISFCEVATVDLTRVYFTLRQFTTAPVKGQIYIDVADIYCYNVSNCSDAMIAHIIEQQDTNYAPGTVTYTIGGITEYAPDTTLSLGGKAADSKAVGDVIEAVGDAIDSVADVVTNMLSATLTDRNTESHIFTVSASSWNFVSETDGVYNFVPSANADTNVYASNVCSLGNGKWLVSFKYKLTKLDSQLSDPNDVRVILGASDGYTFTDYQFDVWNDFTQISDVNLTRVYFSVRGFTTAPTSSQIKLEIKEFYIYNLAGVDKRLYDTIIETQNQDYKSGTVTYEKLGIADVIVGSFSRINVLNYGVKGDGTTDDTAAIRALFSSQEGNFYFPSGTYKITGTIALPGNSTMYGDGDMSVIDMHSCDDLTDCTFRGGEHIYPYILVTGDYTKLHDFKLIGNSTTQTKRHAGVLMMDAENCFISNLTIYNINYLASQTEPNVNAYGICILRSYRAYIDHCYVEQCGYECIGIADSSHHCVVSNCITKNGWRTCIQVHRGAYDVDIIGNQMIQDAQAWDACFTLHGLQDANLVRNLRIENNTFKATVAPRTRAESYAAVVQLMSYCDGLWFVNNRVEAGDRDLAAESTVAHLTVMGNLFQASDTSDYRLRIVSDSPIIVGNVLENTSGTTQVISASAIMAANIGIE